MSSGRWDAFVDAHIPAQNTRYNSPPPPPHTLSHRHEEWLALAELWGLVWWGASQGHVDHLALRVQHKHVLWQHALLLHSAGRHHHLVANPDADATPRARDVPANIQVTAQVAYQFLGLFHRRHICVSGGGGKKECADKDEWVRLTCAMKQGF
jgi:hypothetical protein